MVPANASLSIQFDENIQRTTVAGSTAAVGIYQRSDNALVESYPARTDTTHLVMNGSKLTIKPTAGKLAANQEYYVLIDNGALYSSNGPFKGITDATIWNFAVIPADSTAPVLSSTIPAANSANVDSTGALLLTFSESVTPAEGNLHIIRNDGSNEEQLVSVLSSSVTGAGTSTISVRPPVRLVSGKNYYVLIDNGAFVDMAGNKFSGISSASTWAFTTAAPSVAPPALTPARGSANNTASSPVLTMLFSAPVTAGNGNIYIKRLADNTVVQTIDINDTTSVGGSPQYVTISGSAVSVYLAALAYNTTYYVMVDSGALKQGANEYEGIVDASTWYFTTEVSSSAANPSVSSFIPADNGILASPTGTLKIKFNEPVYPDSGAITIRNANGTLFCNIPVTSTNVTGGGTDTISIAPCASFVNGSSYSVQIGSLAFRNSANKYYAGIASNNTTTWNFTISQDQTPPELVSTYPTNDAIGIRTTGLVLSAVFNEAAAVNPGVQATLQQKSSTTAPPINLTIAIDGSDPKKVWFTPSTSLTPNVQYVVNIPANAITDLAGNAFQGILNDYRWTFKTLSSSTTAPQYKSGALSGNSIILTYDQELDGNFVPSPAHYYVTVNGTARTVTSVKVSENQVTLNLSAGVLVGQAVKVSYTSGVLRNLTGKAAPDLSGKDITNNVDTTIPQRTGGSAVGAVLTINYNKTLADLTNSYSAASQFIVRVNGSSIYPSAAMTSGYSVILTLPVAITGTDTVSVSYSPSSSPIRDTAGNPAAAFSDYYLANSIDKTPPVLTSAFAVGNKITLVFNEGLNTNSVPPASSFSVINGSVPTSVTSVSISGNTVQLTLSQSVTVGTTVIVTYVPAYLPISDLAGNQAATIAGYGVTNTGAASGQLLSASMQGSLLTLTFNAALNTGSVPAASQFFVKANGTYVAVTNVAISGSLVMLTLSSPISTGIPVTVTFFATGTLLKDTSGNTFAAFTDQSVTNGTSPINGLPNYLEKDTGAGLKLNSQGVTTSWGQAASGRQAMKYTVDADKLINGYIQVKSVISQLTGPEIAVTIPASEAAALVVVPVRALLDAQSRISNAVFRIDYGDLQFHFPISSIKYAQEVQQMGGYPATSNIEFSIEKMTSVPQLTTALYSQGFSLLASPADFSATLVSGGQQKAIKDYDLYVKRTFILTSALGQSPEEISVLRYDENTNELAYVPTSTTAISGGGVAVDFMRKSNSIYAVVRKKLITYNDMTKHWAKNDVAFLASKLIVDSSSPGNFSPDRNITRADFAKFIVKGLGLSSDSSVAAKFKDVSVNSAAAAYIGAASKAGIVSGGTDGNFRPNATITREEMASMMLRAMNYAGVQGSTSTSALSKFSDRGKISSYATTAVAACVDAGIISGMTATTFSPKDNATRAQAASMIHRLMKYVEFLPG